VQIVTGDTNGSMTEVLSGGLKPGMQVITGQLAAARPPRGGGDSVVRAAEGGGGGGR
jgi:HlyD family secretion protein